MFAPFQRLTPEPTGNEGSSGLGLPIVRQIVEKHDGRIEVDTEPDRGVPLHWWVRQRWMRSPPSRTWIRSRWTRGGDGPAEQVAHGSPSRGRRTGDSTRGQFRAVQTAPPEMHDAPAAFRSLVKRVLCDAWLHQLAFSAADG
ncbi:MAG: hypothetical protein BRD55_06765 [Bacteroidetes bacterium SW_9_63_38]|nr:MAG: hypothetical protein BRD55_06765 [Bacteroidetes bacterium SW_9_63_38]